jgi:hypothetical protein
VPDNVIACGLVRALSVKVSVPVTRPVAVGVNLIPTVQFPPAGILLPHELLDTMNPVLAVTLLSDNAALRRLVTFTDFEELVVFTGTVPKFSELAENVTGALPVPDKFTT